MKKIQTSEFKPLHRETLNLLEEKNKTTQQEQHLIYRPAGWPIYCCMSTDFRTRVPAFVYYTMKQTALTGEKPTALTVPGHSKWHKVSWAAISLQKDQVTNQIFLCRPTAKMWLHGTNEESNNNKKHIQELREGKKKDLAASHKKKASVTLHVTVLSN